MSRQRRRNDGILPSTNTIRMHPEDLEELTRAFAEMFGCAERQIRCDMVRSINEHVAEIQDVMEQRIEEFIDRMGEQIAKVNLLAELSLDDLKTFAERVKTGTIDRPEGHQEGAEGVQDDVESRREWSKERNPLRYKKQWDRVQFQSLDTKLSEDCNYMLWRDKIVSEIEAQRCGFVIQKNAAAPTDISDEELGIVKSKVRSFIIRHLDDISHSMVRNDLEPSDMIAKLDQKGNPKSVYSSISAFRRISNMRFDPEFGTVSEFFSEFDSLRADLIKQQSNVTDEQIKQMLLVAFDRFCPKLMMMDESIEGGITIARIKDRVFEEEARRRDVDSGPSGSSQALFGSRKSSVQRRPRIFKKNCTYQQHPTSNWGDQKHDRCFRCNKSGHLQDSCKEPGTFCYGCLKLTNHIRANCPVKKVMMKQDDDNMMHQKKKDHLRNKPAIPRQNDQPKLGVLKKSKPGLVPMRSIKRLNNKRIKKGQALLTFFRNGNMPDMCNINMETLTDSDLEEIKVDDDDRVMYAMSRSNDDDDDDVADENDADDNEEDDNMYEDRCRADVTDVPDKSRTFMAYKNKKWY